MSNAGRPRLGFPAKWDEYYAAWRAKEITAVHFYRTLGLCKSTFYRMVAEYGHYTSDYEKAKEDFAKRAGLIPENKVFTSEQAKEIHNALIYRGKYDDELSCKGEEIIKGIVEKLESRYSDSSQMPNLTHLPDAEVEL